MSCRPPVLSEMQEFTAEKGNKVDVLQKMASSLTDGAVFI